MSITLNFELLSNFRWLEIEFESDSREVNLLMKVTMDDFPLDTVELKTTHPLLYRAIESRMKQKANEFWNVQEKKLNKPKTFFSLPDLGKHFETICKDYNETINK